MHRRLILEKTATLTLQRWGNSLAVRIPPSVARSAGFKVGQPVEVSAQHSAVRVAARETLKQKLARFDPERHGGEDPGIVERARLTSSRLMSVVAASAHSSGVKYLARSWQAFAGYLMVTVTC
jgi:antitoxin MazE